MKYSVTGPYPPAILKGVHGWFAVAGGHWVKIPEGTTVEQLRWDNTLKKYATIREVQVPNRPYILKISTQEIACTCPGFGFRRTCRHITEYKQSLEAGL